MRNTKNGGYTFIELLVTLAIVATVLGTAIQAFIQFRRSMSAGEQHNTISREAAFFVENLRKDLQNAVPPTDLPGITFAEIFRCTPSELAFPVFVDAEGTISTVSYQLSGNSLQRSIGAGSPQRLVTDGIASLSWNLQEDGLNQRSPFQAGRIWIHLNAVFGKPDQTGKIGNPFQISTNLFPVRWNRLIWRSPRK